MDLNQDDEMEILTLLISLPRLSDFKDVIHLTE
jgi:hypothetical protein